MNYNELSEELEFSEELLDPNGRGGKIRRKILEIVGKNLQIIIKEVIDSLEESEIPAAPRETATRNHIDRLEKEGLIEKHIDGRSHPLTLKEKGKRVCKSLGIRLLANLKENIIESFNDLLGPMNLRSQEKEKFEDILSDEILETVSKISRVYPLRSTKETLEEFIGGNEWGANIYDILKSAWIFDDQKYEMNSSDLRGTDNHDQALERTKGEGFDALVIASENDCFSKFEELCDFLGELEQRSQRLSKIRDSVKSAYRERKSEEFFLEKEKVPPKVKLKILEEHSEEIKRELRKMKEWIEEADVRVGTKKSMSSSRYEPKDAKIYGHLTEHLPELIEDFREFEGKLNSQNDEILTFSRLLDDESDISALKECYSSVDWKNNINALVNCLEEKGLKLSKDRDLGRKSNGNLVASEGTTVGKRLKNLGKLIDLTFELEERKTRIAEKLDKNIRKTLIPGKCEWVREQFESYGS